MNARALLLPLLAAGAAAAFWLLNRSPDQAGVPAATWRVGDGDGLRQARNYDELAPETPVRLSFSCDAERHVYVFSHSLTDGTLLLFPSPQLEPGPTNPLPAGRTVLPGGEGGADLAWTTRAEVQATTTFLVVAAASPVAELDALLPRLRRWTNTVLPDGSLQITNPPTGDEVAGRPREDLPAALLRRAAERTLTETVVNGPLHADAPGVWTGGFRAKEVGEPRPAPKTSDPKTSDPKSGGGK